MENKNIFPSQMKIYCENCNFELEEMDTEKVMLRLAESGGYFIYDGEGGVETRCPNCHRDRLREEN